MKNVEKIELWEIGRLSPVEDNPKLHPEAQILKIAGSISAYGFNNPLLVQSNGSVIAGHGRLLAAQRLQLTEVPVIVLDHLTAAQARAFLLADNHVSESAWDEEKLRGILEELKASGEELDAIGFSERELARMFDAGIDLLAGGEDEHESENFSAEDDEEISDSASAVKKIKWDVCPGDLWQLGQHRLICGDSTNPCAVDKLLDGAKPHLMVTDPPYGVEYEADWRNEAERSNGKPIGGRAIGKVMNDDIADWGGGMVTVRRGCLLCLACRNNGTHSSAEFD